MQQLSTKNKKPVSKELLWLYVQPSFKQLTKRDLGWWLILTATFFLLPILYDPKVFLEVPWLILIVLSACAFVFWFILKLKPHQQISYYISPEGVDSEFRSTVSPVVRCVKFWIIFFEGVFSQQGETYMNAHSSSVRHLDWNDIIAVKVNNRLRRVTLQAGLKGKLYLWTDALLFPNVIALVKTYTSRNL